MNRFAARTIFVCTKCRRFEIDSNVFMHVKAKRQTEKQQQYHTRQANTFKEVSNASQLTYERTTATM